METVSKFVQSPVAATNNLIDVDLDTSAIDLTEATVGRAVLVIESAKQMNVPLHNTASQFGLHLGITRVDEVLCILHSNVSPGNACVEQLSATASATRRNGKHRMAIHAATAPLIVISATITIAFTKLALAKEHTVGAFLRIVIATLTHPLGAVVGVLFVVKDTNRLF